MNPETNEVTERLKKEYSEIRSYNKLAIKYGVNVRYVWDLIANNKVPHSKKICKKLGIVKKGLSYTRLRNQKLNEIAKLKGFSSWCNYCTHLIKEYEECQNITQ